jgi:colanic acid biosynthesis glycosyl transferase WcaI
MNDQSLFLEGVAPEVRERPVVPKPEVRTGSPRRILLYGLNYAPEPTGIGKYTGEMAHWLASTGHDVRVITTPPYYPDWKVATGYRAWRYTREMSNGVRVERAPLWVPKFPGGAKRLVHLASFAATSLPLLLQSIFWRPHVVFCVAPALACAPGAALAARLSGALSWLHIQDFEVDAAFELGMLRGKSVRAGATGAERALLRSFDRVSSISHRMVANLRDKGVAAGRELLFPNWVDTDAIRPQTSANSFRQELGIPNNAFVALYSGTMGAKQGLDVLAEATHRLAERENMHFIFCGQGAGREALFRSCASLPRVHWLPLQPVERLSELLSTADVHLLPQQRAAADLMLPSKLTGMLASGRPVLATAVPGTELARGVEGCGSIVPPGDSKALADELFSLYHDPDRRRTLGNQARQRALSELSRNVVLEDFRRDMERALSGVGH